MGKLHADVRQALRSVAARRGTSLATVVVLALGVGLTTAMFAITDPFVFRPLPYTDPDELVAIRVGTSGLTPAAEIPSVADWRRLENLFQELGAYRNSPPLRLRLPGGAASLLSREITPGFFRVLGLPEPLLEMEGAAAATPVVLTPAGSRALAFADVSVGRLLNRLEGPGNTANARNLRVVATTPPNFVFPAHPRAGAPDVLAPIVDATPVVQVNEWSDDGRPSYAEVLTVIARLQPGVGAEGLAAALTYPLPSGEALDVDVQTLADLITGSVRSLAAGALASGFLVLLLCAGNIANLMIARGAYRTSELSTRMALGASRIDLARMVVVEVAALSLCGVLLGLMLCGSALVVVRSVIPVQYVQLGSPTITWRVVGAAAASGLAVMLASVLPAALVWRTIGRRNGHRHTFTGARGLRFLRFGFVAAQSALAMILVLGAALLVRSYATLMGQDTGFDADAIVVTVSYAPDAGGAALAGDVSATIDRLSHLPGVAGASASIGPLVDTWTTGMAVRINGKVALVSGTAVAPSFFDTAGMSVVRGRSLAAADAGLRIVVNEALVHEHWPDVSPIGRLIEPMGGSPLEIVGVVADAFDHALDRKAEPEVFELLAEPRYGSMPVNYVLRVDGSTAPNRETVRRPVSEINRDAVIVRMGSLGERLENSVRDRTFATLVLTLFGIAGMSVTVAGLVGVVAFIVARRTREIAIRMALGAEHTHVRRLVTREVIGAAGAGVATGLLLGRWLAVSLESLVYGIEPGDWTVALVAAAATLGVSVLAALVPARRALSLEPTEALRGDGT